jgi:hypothetical protein
MEGYCPLRKHVRNILDALSGEHLFALPFYHDLLRETGFALFLWTFAVEREGLKEGDLLSILCFLGYILERRVNFPLDLECIVNWTKDSSHEVRVAALFLAGNMFESRPDTISIMAGMGFLGLLIKCTCETDANRQFAQRQSSVPRPLSASDRTKSGSGSSATTSSAPCSTQWGQAQTIWLT